MQTNKTLKSILAIIGRDVRRLKRASKSEMLASQEAQNLVRYGEFLFKLNENAEKEKEREKKKLDRLSTEELIKLYQNGDSQ